MKTTIIALLFSAALVLGANDLVVNPPVKTVTSPGPVNVILRDTTGAYVAAGGAGGGGGPATIADGADVAEGATTDASVAAGAAGSISAKLRRLTTDLSTVATNTGAATPTGSNVIGRVGIDQTTPGTTNLVQLPANQSVNEAQVNGVTPLMGNGVTGTGSQRVTVASDNTAFSVNTPNLSIAQGAALGANTGPMVQASVTTAAPGYTTGQISPLSQSITGALRVSIDQVASGTIATNSGNASAQTIRVIPANDSPGFRQFGSAIPTVGQFIGAGAITANPANATGGNAVALSADHAGRLLVTQAQVRELVSVQQTNIATTSETTFITAAGVSVFADLTDLIITTAGSAAQTITIKDVTAGTTRFVLNYPNAAVAPADPLILHFSPPIPQATANSAWTITNSAATAINVTAVYVKNL